MSSSSTMSNEEESVGMEEQEDNSVRMAGYLDKRGKLKLMSTWKRYWFVLKDQLLLYYKSQLECINLSACRGSLNMGLASCVRPGAHRGPPANGNQGYTIEVVTRTQVITLRTKDRVLQEQWLKALLESMALPNISNPLRNSGGPMHFRYSLDNLPIADEHETEEKVKEKQRTLPNRPSVTRHESVLGRIKKMGGQTYGGSLDTILKGRPNNVISQHSSQRSPQQPKIPKIKAVDRMLGLQHEEEEKENMDDQEAGSVNSEENSTKNSSNFNLIPEEQCLSSSTNSISKDENSNKGIKVKVENCEVKSRKLKLDCVTDVNTGNQKLKISVVSSDENQNHEHLKVAKTNDSKDIITTVPKDKHIIFVENEVLVENKLYEKSKTESEQDSLAVINNLYEKAKLGIEDDEIVENKLYDMPKEECDEPSKSELPCNIPKLEKLSEDDKMYETVPVCVDSVKEVHKTSDDKMEEDDDYYCKYDKVSLMQSLSDKHNSSPEPDLPPRPSVGSNDLSKNEQTQTKADDEDGDYDLYYETTESLNAKHSSPSQLLSSSADGSPSEKKGLRFRGKIKLKKKKSPSKESVSSEDVNTDGKKKRKMSFLRRVLKHYRKKPEANSESSTVHDDRGSSDEPEYETVEYAVGVAKHEETADKATDTAIEDDASISPEREVHKDKLFGTKSLLTEQAMLELRMKLKERDDITDFSTSVSAIDEHIEGYELVTSDDIPDKKPVPTPRPSKQKSSPDEKDIAPEVPRYHCNDSINRPNKPPSLPPRRVARPRSPWHDVPTNNSPVYGNFLDFGINVTDKTEEKKVSSEQAVEKQPVPEAGEWDEELQDELLGTPRGFAYIQNKWKAAEKSGEWDKVFQKSPPKERSPDKHSSTEELKVKQSRRSVSSESVTSGEGESKTVVPIVTSDIYSDVNKPQLSAKTIIKCFNSQSDRNSNDLHKVETDEKHNCVLKKISEVTAVECKISKDLELNVGNIKTNNHDTSDIENHNSNTGTVHNEGCDFNDDDVILRKSQMYTNFSHTNQNIISNKTDQFRIVNGDSQNEHIFSSHVSEIHSEGILKESRNRMEVSTQQHVFTTPNIFCQQNTGVFKESRPVLQHEEMEEYDIMPRLNRHSDELNLLLAQLAEITSAPLLPQGAATSLVDLPEGRKPRIKYEQPSQSIPAQPESFVLGPIRRRRHSDPDYDVPRPHGSLLHLLASNRITNRSQNQSGQEGDVIEATRFFGEADLTSNSTRSSLSLRHSVISEVDDQSDTSYYVSMAPDSLEVPSNVDRSM